MNEAEWINLTETGATVNENAFHSFMVAKERFLRQLLWNEWCRMQLLVTQQQHATMIHDNDMGGTQGNEATTAHNSNAQCQHMTTMDNGPMPPLNGNEAQQCPSLSVHKTCCVDFIIGRYGFHLYINV